MTTVNTLLSGGQGVVVPSGFVGEASTKGTWSNASFGSIGATNNLTSITLNKGNYLVISAGSSSTSGCRLGSSINTTSATRDTGTELIATGSATNNANSVTVFKFLTITSDSTPVYAVGFTPDGTVITTGYIQAFRLA